MSGVSEYLAKKHGKVMYKSNNKKISVNSKGKVTVKKGIKKGTYKILLTVKGNSNYQSGRKMVKIVIE